MACVTDIEFWSTIGCALGRNLESGKQGHRIHEKCRDAIERIDGLVETDRRQVLDASFALNEHQFCSVLRDLRMQWSSLISTGYLLLIDETILSSDSKKAANKGRIRFIEGKPHPKGYFYNASVQKLLLSKSIFVLDLEVKWGFDSPNMGDAAIAIVRRCEQQYSHPFDVLLDSGYPASKFLLRPLAGITSKFVCSVSTAKVSGALRHLPMCIGPISHLDQHMVFRNKKRQLTAYMRTTKEYTICLVTNAASDPIWRPPKLPPRAMSWSQASSLAANFSVNEMVHLLGFPKPTDAELDEDEVRYAWKFIKKHTGVDISAPLDSSGFVSRESLGDLLLPELKRIADIVGVKKKISMKKDDYIDSILRKHPKASPAEFSQSNRKKRKEATNAVPSHILCRSLEKELQDVKRRFLQTVKQPDFASMYAKNYGLEDQMNSLIYDNFRHTLSHRFSVTMSWNILYICTINAFGLWKEIQLDRLKSASKSIYRQVKNTPLVDFCNNLLIQLADYVCFPTAASAKR
jgi:hypothetical protein